MLSDTLFAGQPSKYRKVQIIGQASKFPTGVAFAPSVIFSTKQVQPTRYFFCTLWLTSKLHAKIKQSPSVIVIAMTNEKDEKKEFVANGGKRLKLGDIDEETLNSGEEFNQST